MSRDVWGKRPKRQKQKRDAWSKPRKGKRRKEFGAVPKKEKKKDKQWGKPEGKGDKGILSKFGGERSGGWLGKFFRPQRVSLRQYYNKLDQLQADQINAGVREQLAERYEREIERADSITDKLSRWAEGILRRRLSPGQTADIRAITKEVVSPNRVVAFVTNLFK
jgi:hypothetical protein